MIDGIVASHGEIVFDLGGNAMGEPYAIAADTLCGGHLKLQNATNADGVFTVESSPDLTVWRVEIFASLAGRAEDDIAIEDFVAGSSFFLLAPDSTERWIRLGYSAAVPEPGATCRIQLYDVADISATVKNRVKNRRNQRRA